MSAQQANEWRDFLEKFVKPITGMIGFAATLISVCVAASDIGTWWLAGVSVLFGLLFAGTFYVYIRKSASLRSVKDRVVRVLGIFARTHTTWHLYKRLNDSLQAGMDIDDAVLKVQRDVLNIISHFRGALGDMHPTEVFRVSVKMIEYKSLQTLDDADGQTYVNQPFRLVDLPSCRDTEAGPTKREEVIDDLDFDSSTNPGGIALLKASLFWKCFLDKKVVYANRFDELQKSLTKVYESGLVAPIVFHGIPFAFICVGSKREGVFAQDDVELVCTFTDACSEYFRFKLILEAIQKSKKVVVMNDVVRLLDAADGALRRIAPSSGGETDSP